jgi:hypothetical protein
MKKRLNSFNTYIVLVTLLSLLLGSCATKDWPVTSTNKLILTPELNVQLVSELGDTLVDQGSMITRDAIRTNDEIQAKCDGLKLYLGKGLYAAKLQDENYVYYFPVDAKVKAVTIFQQDAAKSGMTPGYAKSKSTGIILPFGNVTGYEIGEFLDGSTPIFFEDPIEIKSSPAFRQQLIYNGRVGNNLRFIYREFSSNLARDSFSQEMQYDFSESKTIGFKGVRIEVIKASNTQIEYKVLSHFRR